MARKGLGEQLRDIRTTLGLTQKDVAKSLGLSPSRISQVETRKRLDGNDLIVFARFYGVPLQEFCNEPKELTLADRRAMWIFEHIFTDEQRSFAVDAINTQVKHASHSSLDWRGDRAPSSRNLGPLGRPGKPLLKSDSSSS